MTMAGSCGRYGFCPEVVLVAPDVLVTQAIGLSGYEQLA